VDLKQAYDRSERAEELELEGDREGALREREAARSAFPDNPEFAFWTALSLAGQGRLDEAKVSFSVAASQHQGWTELLRRLVDDDQVELNAEAVAALRDGGDRK
jgi:hypothetical protein